VLIAYKGYPISRQSRGYANLYAKTRLDDETIFQLASVSKGFTAMAVLLLHQNGKLNIEDTVQHYIPEFPFNNVTIRHLLQHTSGLQNYMYFVDNYWEKDKSLGYEDVLKLLNDHNPVLSFRPGRRYNYSNTGYAMLALLVERVSGLPFHSFVKENIFDPLGMDHSFVWNAETMDTISNIATGFQRRGRRFVPAGHDPLDEIGGDKSVYSTIDDLLKWDQSFYSNKLLNDSLLKLSFIKTVTPRNRRHDYGLGWRLTVADDKQVIYHNGLWNGFTTSLTRYVEDSVTIIVLCNNNAPVASFVKKLYNTVKDDILTDWKNDDQDTELADMDSQVNSN
jgi:CubicO group peptidase (beta-lactamase class C family)